MISKQKAKFVKSLKLKKYRLKASSFLVEGAKNVIELIHSAYEIEDLFVTQKFLDEYSERLPDDLHYEICKEKDLIYMGTFLSNGYALAVARMTGNSQRELTGKVVIALDSVNDPGNLGTIIRIADWYGIDTIVASNDSADFYNPKVINASMGSFTRVYVHYMDLEHFFESNTTHKIYGAVLDGRRIHQAHFATPLVVLMGNESKGITSSLMKYIDERITIPRFGGAESLNVAVSTAIICDNVMR